MIGLSDSTLGIVTSVLLHVGVAAAFLGPLGSGKGPQDVVVMVTVEGAEEADSEGREQARQDLSLPKTETVATVDGKQAQKREFRVTQPPPQKRQEKPREFQPELPSPAVTGHEGGGGLFGALYAQPRLVSIPKPEYPAAARRRGIEGKVRLTLHVTPLGTVDSAEIAQGSGLESFDAAARESALKAVFQPAQRAGVPEASVKDVVVTFSLVE